MIKALNKGENMRLLGLIFLMGTMAIAGGKGDIRAQSAVVQIHKGTCACKPGRVVRQPGTCLMWQDAPYTDAEDGAYRRNYSVGKAGNYNHAVNYCRSLIYAGFDDWRLPTADELMSAHELRGELFLHQRDGDFWTSTPSTDKRYYVVYPPDAMRYKRYKKESNYIRCVRCISETINDQSRKVKSSNAKPLFEGVLFKSR